MFHKLYHEDDGWVAATEEFATLQEALDAPDNMEKFHPLLSNRVGLKTDADTGIYGYDIIAVRVIETALWMVRTDFIDQVRSERTV